jgi:septum formation protein
MATATSDGDTAKIDGDPLKNLPHPLILGSASFTRKLILKQMGVDFIVVARPIDERQVGFRDTDTPEQLVHAVAHAKMRHLIKEIAFGNCDNDLPNGNGKGEWIVLTADQVVTCKGRILEKPIDVIEAKEFVTQYGSHPCSTVACVALTHLPSYTTVSGIHSVTIHFLPTLTAERASDLIDELMKSNEPILSCAGALMIEHPSTQHYVDRIDGNVESVMGLCPETVRRLLNALREALPHPMNIQ